MIKNNRLTVLLVIASALLMYCNAKTVDETHNGIYISEFMAANDTLRFGEEQKTFDWIEIHNSSKKEVDLSGIYLSDNSKKPKKALLSGRIAPGDYKVLYASGRNDRMDHVAFKLNKQGGELLMSNEDGELLDSFNYKKQVKNYSSVRDNDGWVYSPEYSPGAKNDVKITFSHLSQEVHAEFEEKSSGEVTAVLSTKHSTELTYRVLESGETKKDYQSYKGPVLYSPGQVIQVKAKGKNVLEDKSSLFSYVPFSKHSLPVISLTTNPENLWDEKTGIYTPKNSTQRGDDWIRKGFVTYEDGDSLIKEKVDYKIFGNASRSKPKKSFTLKSKSGLDNAFFSSVEKDKVDGFIVRACHVGMTMYRNELINDVDKYLGSEMMMQEYVPAVFYLNGEYWGVYNIMEKKNDEYIKNHTGTRANDMVSMNDRQVKDVKGYSDDLKSTIKRLIKLEDDDQIYSLLDSTFIMGELLDFFAHEFIVNRVDTYNNRFYRSSTSEDGRWGVITFDYDIIFGKAHSDKLFVKYFNSEPDNGLLFITTALRSKKFKDRLVKRMCEFLNFGYTPHVMDDLIGKYGHKVIGEFSSDTARWNTENRNAMLRNPDDIMNSLNRFMVKRKEFIHDEIFPEIGYTQKVVLTIPENTPAEIYINGFEVRENATFYTGMELSIEVKPNDGVDFLGWFSGSEKMEIRDSITFEKETVLVPMFEP